MPAERLLRKRKGWIEFRGQRLIFIKQIVSKLDDEIRLANIFFTERFPAIVKFDLLENLNDGIRKIGVVSRYVTFVRCWIQHVTILDELSL